MSLLKAFTLLSYKPLLKVGERSRLAIPRPSTLCYARHPFSAWHHPLMKCSNSTVQHAHRMAFLTPALVPCRARDQGMGHRCGHHDQGREGGPHLRL